MATYKELWQENKRWLESSMTYLEQQQQALSAGKERERVTAKLDGLNAAYQFIIESEQMYELDYRGCYNELFYR